MSTTAQPRGILRACSTLCRRRFIARLQASFLGLAFAFTTYSANAAAIPVTSSVSRSGNQVRIGFIGNADSYYFLYSSTNLGVLTPMPFFPKQSQLGVSAEQFFTVDASDEMLFLKIESRENALLSLDYDQDGISDGWELEHGLNAVDPRDASFPCLGSPGKTWLDCYEEQLLPTARFQATNSLTVVNGITDVPIILSKPIQGAVRVALGGTALFGVDYAVVGASRVVSTGPSILYDVPVDGANASIRIAAIDTTGIFQDRIVTLSLAASPDSKYELPTDGIHTHIVTLKESPLATRGLFTGALYVTNAVYLDAQTLKMALRKGTVTAWTAYFDVSEAPFFGEPFEIPVEFSGANIQFSGSANGSLPSPGGPREGARWTLTIPSTITDANGVLTAQFRLDLIGLTASGRTSTALGTLTLSPLN